MAEILPPKYYLHNFLSLLTFVQEKCTHLLQEPESLFMHAFNALSEDAQCLFLRMANRRKLIFRRDHFDYTEIASIEDALQELQAKGFARPIAKAHQHLYAPLADSFSKQELLPIIETLGIGGKGFSSMKKPALVGWVCSQAPMEEFLEAVKEQTPVYQGFVEEMELLLFFYFGTIHLDMTQFVVQQLGHTRFEAFDEALMVPYFRTRQEADDKLKISKLQLLFYELREIQPPEELHHSFMERLPRREELSDSAHVTYDRLCLRLGEWGERHGLWREALSCYALIQRPPARERRARLLQKMGEAEKAQALVKHILETHQDASEKYFALDFLQEGKKVKSITAYLKQAPSCTIPEHFRNRVEEGALHWYAQQGFQGFHHENFVWRGLFGLLFWEVIFDMETASIHHPFQRVPSDWRHPDFFPKRKARFEAQCQLLQAQGLDFLRAIYEKKDGIINPFVYWHEDLMQGIALYLQYLSPQQIQAVLLEMARNVHENTAGLPDLFIFKESEYAFVEVKSPTDALSAQQLYWLEFFAEHRIKAYTLRVKFEKG